jgi:sugar/nucleoside kinase (ribokinase family)
MKKNSFFIALIFCLVNSLFAFAEEDLWASKKYDVFAVGLSTVHKVYLISDEDFKRLLAIPYNLEKGQMISIDKKTLGLLENKLTSISKYPSGSTTNIVNNLASFGAKVSYNTLVSDDESGRNFVEYIKDQGVMYVTPPKKDTNETSSSLIFITPDKERTILTYSAIADEMSQLEVKFHEIKDHKVILLEAGIWDKDGERSRAALRAVNTATKVASKKAFSMQDVYFIKKHREEILNFIGNFDLILGNDHEAKALFATDSIDEIINGFRKLNVEAAVVTFGSKGALIITKNDVMKIPPPDVKKEEIVDKTGAGDAFAAGFLYGYTHGMSLKDSGMLGSKAAGKVITQLGGTNTSVKLSSLL